MLKCFFYESRICKHEPSDWVFREMGMGKVRYCKKCGKILNVI